MNVTWKMKFTRFCSQDLVSCLLVSFGGHIGFWKILNLKLVVKNTELKMSLKLLNDLQGRLIVKVPLVL